jgi:hypothetical protein
MPIQLFNKQLYVTSKSVPKIVPDNINLLGNRMPVNVNYNSNFHTPPTGDIHPCARMSIPNKCAYIAGIGKLTTLDGGGAHFWRDLETTVGKTIASCRSCVSNTTMVMAHLKPPQENTHFKSYSFRSTPKPNWRKSTRSHPWWTPST